MDLLEIGERIAHLRCIRNVSAREMSFSVGLSANHINKMENGKAIPSLATLFDICDYLKISPKDFFDTENNDPNQVSEMVNDYKRLDSDAQANVAGIIKELARDSR